MNISGAISYGVAAVAFTALAAILAVSWRGRASGLRLVGAVTATAVWAIALAFQAWRGLDTFWVLLAEQLRLGAWLLALGGLATSLPRLQWLVRVGYAAAMLSVATGLALWMLDLAGFQAPAVQRVLLGSGIGLPLIGLAVLEQLYRNSHASGRHALRPLFIGAGGMFLFDVFLYSEAIMSLAIGAEAWALRGLVAAACAPPIAWAARRNPDWSLDVFVSRQVVFYTTTFMAVGSYLLAMALGSYVIARSGAQWGELAQFLFLAGAAVLLAVLVGSESTRGRFRVFLAKHFYRNKYDYRVEWLRFVNALNRDGELIEARPAMIRAAAQIVGSRHGALWVAVDDDRRLVVATTWDASGENAPTFAALDASSEFVRFLERRQWIVDLVEYRHSPETYENIRLPDALAAPHDLRLFVPLMHGGRMVGLLALGPPAEPFRMTYEDRDLLRTAGSHIGTHVAQLESDRKLTESRQFETYSRLAAFLMHDLKNLVAQLSLVVANAERHRRNPDFVDDAIETIRNSTSRMTRLIDQLQRRELPTTDRRVSLREVLERVMSTMGGRDPAPTLETVVADAAVIADPDRLASTLEHVIRNGQDAASGGGAVSVRFTATAGRGVVQVADTGCGMTADFINQRLFRPFDSTKGASGMGIGAYQVRDYVHSIGGDVHVTSTPGAGTVFSISLPLAPDSELD